MTRQELWVKINKEDADMLCNLRERWADEHEYEDINEYLTFIQKSIPEAFAIHKRPFGVDLKATDGNMRVSVVVKGRYLQLQAKSI